MTYHRDFSTMDYHEQLHAEIQWLQKMLRETEVSPADQVNAQIAIVQGLAVVSQINAFNEGLDLGLITRRQ